MSGFITWLKANAKTHPLYAILAGVAAIVLLFAVSSQVSSCRYDKGRKEYEAKEEAWKTERAKLIATAEEKERRIAELEPQVQAFKAAAEAGKKVDEALAQKIEDVAKESADAEANAQVPTDCRTRADRICTMFRAGDSRFDCKPIFDACPK